MAASAVRHPEIAPSHPGELLADVVIPATGKSKAEIARLLGISRQSLYDVLRGKQGVTPGVAIRLGKLFGNGPILWLDMQRAHDLWYVERALRAEVDTIPTLKAA